MFLLFAVNINAQIEIDGQLRTKFEYRDGYKTLLPVGANAAYVATQRSRLNFKYSNDKLKTFLSVQDVRIWGEQEYKTDVATLSIHQAWGEILFNDFLSLKIGRQELRYDDERLFAYRNWNDVGATHDVALLKYNKNKFETHVGFAYNNQKSDNYRTSYNLNYYKALGFVWISKSYSNGLKLSAIAIGDGYQKENSVDSVFVRYTYGGNVFFDNKESLINYRGTAYLQSGKDKTGNSISAYFFSSKLSLKPNSNWTVVAGIDYFSGNDALSGSSKTKAFSKLYGVGHNFYGYMDYFTEIEQHTKGGGLMDVFLGAKKKFSERMNLELNCHNFSFTNNVIDPLSDPLNPMAADKHLGVEIDLAGNYKYTETIDFRFGYSAMFASKSMEIIKNGSSDRYLNWGWVMITLKPVFYKQKSDKADKENN